MRPATLLLTAALTSAAALPAAHPPAGAAVSTAAAPPAGSALQHDADAVHAAGITGVLAESDLVGPDGRTRRTLARSGVADLTTARPPAYASYIRLGSTTKTYVATIVLQLVGEHRISLDEPVARLLPGVVTGNGNDGRRITVRQLLQHTSGLYDYTHDLIPTIDTPAEYARNRDRTYTPDELIAIALRHPPDFAPGTRWEYSNTNYILAGMLIHRVTGHPWYTEVRSRILRPLQLTRTLTPEVTDTRLPDPHATTYQQFSPDGPLTDVTIPPRFLESGADGSLIATTGDLGRFLRALLSGRLLPPGQLRAMMTTVPTGEPGRAYGLGLEWKALPCGGGYWGHGGNGLGYSEVNAVTADGHRSTVVATTSRDLDETPQLDATARLLADAMCAIHGPERVHRQRHREGTAGSPTS
jgi:D-alanyl-D-alanine carboxypeptidase